MKNIKTFNQLFENTMGNQKYPNVVTFGRDDYEKFSKYIDHIDRSGETNLSNWDIKKDKSKFYELMEDVYISFVDEKDLFGWFYNTRKKSLSADKIETPDNIELFYTAKIEKYSQESDYVDFVTIEDNDDPKWEELKTILWLSTLDDNIHSIEKSIKNCSRGEEFKMMSRIRKYSPDLANQLGISSNDMADLGDLGF